ncbi:unnamed protein product [Pleuronectes platessa]|uniref:Uncharacterized protein n=1 Tax=Pleuronectes platessa TaxID=8262 RepID=A0A9N7ZDV9_PLEPL|nr:unnamed protein product [Pleuronectes platessa]
MCITRGIERSRDITTPWKNGPDYEVAGAAWRISDKFISEPDALHFCSTAAGERASKGERSKELFETKRHWSRSLDDCHAALMACNYTPAPFSSRSLWGLSLQSDAGETLLSWTEIRRKTQPLEDNPPRPLEKLFSGLAHIPAQSGGNLQFADFTGRDGLTEGEEVKGQSC